MLPGNDDDHCFGRRPDAVFVVNRKRLLITGVITTVVVVAVVISLPWLHIYTGAAPPDQFYRPLSAPAEIPARQVLGIAHNAGNNAATTAAALRYGADVIEIDVITARGTLVAGRAQGWPWLAGLISGDRRLPAPGCTRRRRKSSNSISSRMAAACSTRWSDSWTSIPGTR